MIQFTQQGDYGLASALGFIVMGVLVTFTAMYLTLLARSGKHDQPDPLGADRVRVRRPRRLDALTLFPLYWILLTSFKPASQIAEYPVRYWPSEFSFENYHDLFDQMKFGHTAEQHHSLSGRRRSRPDRAAQRVHPVALPVPR